MNIKLLMHTKYKFTIRALLLSAATQLQADQTNLVVEQISRSPHHAQRILRRVGFYPIQLRINVPYVRANEHPVLIPHCRGQ
jgi:hypothetical protein